MKKPKKKAAKRTTSDKVWVALVWNNSSMAISVMSAVTCDIHDANNEVARLRKRVRHYPADPRWQIAGPVKLEMFVRDMVTKEIKP